MKMSLLILTLTLIFVINSKSVTKIFYKSDLQTTQKAIFLTKFDFGTNGGMIRLKAKRKQDDMNTEMRLLVDVVIDQQLQSYKQKNCIDRKQHTTRSQQLNLQANLLTDIRNVKIPQQSHEHIYYLYYAVCFNDPIILQNQNQHIEVEITMYNDGSHFGEDEKLLPGYFAMMTVWVVLLIKYALPLVNSVLKSQDQTRITVFSGLIILGFAYFYRLLHLGIYYADGQGVYFFYILYILLKTSCQFIIVTVIVAVGWGWSITHLSHDQSYILAGVTTAIINTVGLIVNSSADEHVDEHHKYDSTAGTILLLLRILILIIFFIGSLRTYNNQTGKIRKFIKKLALVGGIYLAVWPLIVIFSQIFLPNYMHNEVITFVQEFTHLIGIWLLCQMMSHPESIYRKISIKQEDNPLKMQNYKRK